VPKNYDCITTNTNQISYNLDTNSLKTFNIEKDMLDFPICQNGSKCTIKPQIKVISKNISGFMVNDSLSNSDLSFNIEKIYLDHFMNLILDYGLNNVSKNFVKIESISLYIDDDIISMPVGKGFELQPRQKLTKKSLFLPSSGRAISSATKNKINFALNKSNDTKTINIGISIKFTLDGIQKTLFESKEYSLKKLAGIL